MNKICIITSKGGHLLQISQLKPIFKNYARFWISIPGKDTESTLQNEKVYYAYYPESRNFPTLIKNSFKAFRILFRERPQVLISSGAGVAIPFFFIGKIFFKTKLIYIESFDFIAYPSMTGKLLYRICDLFFIQHKEQQTWYPKATYLGPLL